MPTCHTEACFSNPQSNAERRLLKAACPSDSTAAIHKLRALLQESPMLHYAVVFFIIALVAALFGFGGIAASAAGIGKILFIIFAVLALATFLFGLIR
jgi:uncharacterized membrane protein YtjA (UPF0391 family)